METEEANMPFIKSSAKNTISIREFSFISLIKHTKMLEVQKDTN